MSKATQGEVETEQGVTLEINDQEVQAGNEQTILEAAREAGIDIPTLCEHKHLSNVGACRMCLVEVDGQRTETACTTTVQDGMDVVVDTDELWTHRRNVLELMFADQNHYCMYCEMEGDCELEDMFNRAGLDSARFPLSYEDVDPDTSHEHITMDLDRCIGCGRCIRMCDEIVGNKTLGFAHRGRETTVAADDDVLLGESSCISCGACVQACPTGALYSNYSAYRGREGDCEVVTTTCCECSVGCELEVYTNSGRIVKIKGNEDGPAGGQLCEMGRFELLGDNRNRITEPRINGDVVDLETASANVADLLADGDVNAMATDRLPTETLETFADTLAEYDATLSVEGAERAQFEARARNAVAEQFGVDADDLTTDSVHDIEDSEALIVFDTGIVDTHPVVASYIRRAGDDGATVLTVDDGEDQLDRFADHSIELDASTATLTGYVADVFDEGTTAIEDTTVEDITDLSLELSGNATFVVGPDVDDWDTLINIFGLAAMSSNDVFSLTGGANQAVETLPVEELNDEPDVAYLFAADDSGGDLDAMLTEARKADTIVVHATRESTLTDVADVVLPALDWFERTGTFVDVDGTERKLGGVLESRAVVETDRELVESLRGVTA